MFNRLSARIAVSEAAAWTGRRWFGGRYEIIPNGVDVDARPERARSRPRRSCGSLFVGRAEERKGLPILLSAFGALAEHVPCRLTVIGAERDGRPALPRRPRDDARHRRPRPGLRRRALAAPPRGRPALRARRSPARASGWS